MDAIALPSNGLHPTPFRAGAVQFADPPGSTRPIGDSGLMRFDGVVYEETATNLRGTQWHRVVREMQQSPIIKGMLFATEMLIRRAEWTIQPATGEGINDDAAEDVVKFVESCRTDMRITWEDTLASVLSFLPYGFSLFEVIYKRRLGLSGDPSSEADDGRIGWDEWSPRAQDTIEKWIFDDSGHAIGFVQRTPSMGVPVEIPMTKCLHFRAGGYRGNPEGESVLRAAYQDWDAINKLQLIEAIGIERDLAGLPVAWIPAKYLSAAATDDEKKVAVEMKRTVQDLRQNSKAGVVMPLEHDERGNKQYDIQLLSASGSRQFDTSAVINRRAGQMTMTMMADFLMLGHSNTGTYALSQDKTRLFTTAIEAWLDAIANTIVDQAVRPLMQINGMDPALTPRLQPGDVAEQDLTRTGAFFNALLPLIKELNEVDRLALTTHLFDLADWPAITTEAGENPEPEVDVRVREKQVEDLVPGGDPVTQPNIGISS